MKYYDGSHTHVCQWRVIHHDINESGVKHQHLKKNIWSPYTTESSNIHCHDMKDPTQLYNFNYLINTKNNHIQQFTRVNDFF